MLAGLNAAITDGPPKHLFFDTVLSGNTRTTDELRLAATMIANYRYALSGRCAVLVATPLHFGLARMFGAFLEPLGFDVFVTTSPAEAEQYLDGITPSGHIAAWPTEIAGS